MAVSKATRLAERLVNAKERVEAVRAELDAELAARHAAGASIAQLTRETRLSRQGVYDAIERQRSRTTD